MSRKILLGLVAAVSVVACVFLIAVLVGQGLVRAGLWAGIVGALAGVVAAAAAVWPLVPRPLPLPPGLEVEEWVIDRPAEVAAVIKALVSGRAGTVGITGAEGFGKTTWPGWYVLIAGSDSGSGGGCIW